MWHNPRTAAAAPAVLAAGCHRAALAYPHFVAQLLFGIIGVAMPDAPTVAPALRVRPVGPTILQFGPLQRLDAHQLAYPITGGLLAITDVPSHRDGALSFAWYRHADAEVFQTQLRGFLPSLCGRHASALRQWFYRRTQTYLHAFVMWRFHHWVRRHRDALLRDYPLLRS